jgi:hypothetical protein
MPPDGMPETVRVDKYVCVVLCMAAACMRPEHESEANSLILYQKGKCELGRTVLPTLGRVRLNGITWQRTSNRCF